MININKKVEYQKTTDSWVQIDRLSLEIRAVLGFVVNTVYRDLIAFLTPIVLMQSNNAMDFVQNCFAVSYITTLDDLSESRILTYRRRRALPPDSVPETAPLLADDKEGTLYTQGSVHSLSQGIV